MKGLNDRSNDLLMKLIDQMAGQRELGTTINGQHPLTITLVDTDIYINSRKTVGNLYNLSLSDSPNGKDHNPGMQFLIIDRRKDGIMKDPVEIYPVSYRKDEIKTFIEGVIIQERHVHEVSAKWQIEYARFANQWIKRMGEMGYFTEYLKRDNAGDDVVCMCGNNNRLNGYDPCDENGVVNKEIDSPHTHWICLNCKRVVDINTLEVTSQLLPTQNVKTPKTSFDIYKQINTMSDMEKAKLFHVLCTYTIRAFLSFVDDQAQNVIKGKKSKYRSSFNENFSSMGWKRLAENVSQTITTSMNRLATESDLFAKVLFNGYNKQFIHHSIQQYLTVCPNERVCRGIEFIFGL